VPPFPPCETTGLVHLCTPAALLTNGSWFTLQVPNLVWFLSVAGLVVAGLILPFPTREVGGADDGKGERP
jgi:hypothetical protein